MEISCKTAGFTFILTVMTIHFFFIDGWTVQHIRNIFKQTFNEFSRLPTLIDHSEELIYISPSTGQIGKNFSVKLDTLKYARAFEKSNSTNAGRLVIATACSSNHYKESLDAISSVHRYLPHAKIIYYNLGLNAQQTRHLKTLCNLELRNFNFSAYPTHVRGLFNYAWKVLVISELLRDFDRFIWTDASIRFTCPDVKQYLEQFLASNPPADILMADTPGHTIFAATHKGMYDYLRPNVTRMKTLQMEAAYFLWVKRTTVAKSVLHWAIPCALDPNCIAPPGNKLGCKMWRKTLFKDCHRYDQSLFSILLANKFSKKTSIIYERKLKCVDVIRGAQNKVKHLKTCLKSN